MSLISWSHQYPDWLYPGVQRLPQDTPETPPFPGTSYPLSWKKPHSWLKVGRDLRAFDLVIIVVVASVQAPAYLAMLSARGKAGGRVLALCHNVLPHERRFFDAPLTRAVLRRVDSVLVHSEAQVEVVRSLVQTRVECADIPPHLPARPKPGHAKPEYGAKRRLLFFGLIRQYKGLDVLLRALAKTPDVSLTVAGEFWGDVELYQSLLTELGLRERVTLLGGYVPSAQITELFASADALVLPYRSGTATQNILLAHAHGLPVIATRVAAMARYVRDELDGLLCRPDDVDDLARAIQRFYAPGVAQGLYAHVPPVTGNEGWETYLDVLLARR